MSRLDPSRDQVVEHLVIIPGGVTIPVRIFPVLHTRPPGPDWAPMAAVNLGVLLQAQGDVIGAKTAYQAAIDSNHTESAPMAVRLILLLDEESDIPGIESILRRR